jgi:3-oxoacyl-[acyl-carrier protein] reductase
MDLQLKGKIAFVAGSSRGLGFATAQLLAEEGARVAVNSRTQANADRAAAQIASATGAEVIGLAGDVSEPTVPQALIQQVTERMGGLDILITNSGGPRAGAFEELGEDDWQNAVNLSLMSHVRLIRAALPALKRSQAASVLTITSYSVKQPIPNLVLSNSVRSATIGLTKTLALELGREGIRFNSILPAWTETERVTELMQNRAQTSGTTVEEEQNKQAKESAIGRMADPREFANPAVFLVSPVASYITGVMLAVDGGMYKGTF